MKLAAEGIAPTIKAKAVIFDYAVFAFSAFLPVVTKLASPGDYLIEKPLMQNGRLRRIKGGHRAQALRRGNRFHLLQRVSPGLVYLKANALASY